MCSMNQLAKCIYERKRSDESSLLLLFIIYIIYTRGIPSAKSLKYISIKNKYIKIQWMGLIFQGVVFEFNSAPQMYLEVFINCCKVESSLMVLGISL